ncbi:MAG: hypothetical protein JWL66_891 [Sphingomonadales bacterium]|nr:hypothetical protein [Sphingomonadales bacterium]
MKLTSGKPTVYSLTSPPEKPDPEPPKELIAKVMEYDDRKILVTVPFPDSIELITDVFNDLLMTPYATGGSAKSVYNEIDADLTGWVAGYKTGETVFTPSPTVNNTSTKARYFLAYDAIQPLNRATLTLLRRLGPDYPIWSVRLEFSASKAGPEGLMKLLAGLEEALPLNVPALLGSFLVSRVDPAIDLIGANPLDLIGHVPKPGKRLVYVGSHGRPETIYLYDAKKPLKSPPKSVTYNTLGTLRLKLYERRDYFRQLMLPPPYGNSPVTRAEIEMRWKKGRPYLRDLAEIKNLLKDRRVSYAPAVLKTANASTKKNWILYCLATFGGGAAKAQAKWPLSLGLKFRALYRGSDGDLLNETMWSRWENGISITGLDKWIKVAKANILKDELAAAITQSS